LASCAESSALCSTASALSTDDWPAALICWSICLTSSRLVVAPVSTMIGVWAMRRMARSAISQGAAGVDMGRNIFQAEAPVAMIQAVRKVVHEGMSPEHALAFYQNDLGIGNRLLGILLNGVAIDLVDVSPIFRLFVADGTHIGIVKLLGGCDRSRKVLFDCLSIQFVGVRPNIEHVDVA